jgi:hypothetical protein
MTASKNDAVPEDNSDGSETDELIENREVTEDGSYAVTQYASVTGKLDFDARHTDPHSDVTVEATYEQNGYCCVALDMAVGGVRIGTTFEPSDARDLAARLTKAADAAEGEIDV